MLTGQRGDLGRAVAREWAAGVHGGRGRTLVNLSMQAPNSLLHDGHAWQRDAAEHIVASTRRALAEARRTRCGFVVHASYAFLAGAEAGGTVGGWLEHVIDAALEAERLVLGSDRSACVIRLGYLYGPDSVDLRAYRRAFHLGRPYWAGPRANLQHFLQISDAARALLIAAATRPAERVLYATDGTAVSFADFMDEFAHRVGRSHPLHLPRVTRPLVHAVVRESHQQMVDLAQPRDLTPKLSGFTPDHPDYRGGIDDVIEAWRQAT